MGKRKVRGLTIRNDAGRAQAYRLSFTYKGVHCRESLSIPVTPANTKYAERLLGEIQNSIERGTFRYADYFPNSKKCEIFGMLSSRATVGDYLQSYYNDAVRRKLSPSTLQGYKKLLNRLAEFNDMPIGELTAADIKRWVTRQDTTIKTMQNILSFLKSAVRDAVVDGAIVTNPVTEVSITQYAKRGTSTPKIDPFTPEEIHKILSSCEEPNLKNLFTFAFHTGLRSSELIGLRWAKVDFDKRRVLVDTAKILGELKAPKTVKSERYIELDEEAYAALVSQKALGHDYEMVFINPLYDRPWDTVDQIRKTAWKPLLELAGVRYRKAYNTRHTFATMHISRGANIWWLCGQMGHTTPSMLFKHYGTYIKEFEDAKP